MTSACAGQRENFIARFKGEPSDRTPIFLFDLTLGMEVAGYRTPEVFANGFSGQRSAESLIALQRAIGHDAVLGSVMVVDGRAFGAEMAYPDHGPPHALKPAFAEPDDLYLYSPSDVEGPSLEGTVLSYQTVRERAGDVATVFHVPSPFTLSVLLRGFEGMMFDLLSDGPYTRDLVRFSSEVLDVVVDTILSSADADVAMISGAYDNADLLGPEGFLDLPLRSLSGLLGRIGRYDLPSCFHPHGALSDNDNAGALGSILGSGIDCLYFGEGNDQAKLLERCKGQVSLMGGIDTFTTLFLGPDQRVVEDTTKCMGTFAGEDHILSCSCSVDRGLPLDRIKLMASTVRRLSNASDGKKCH